MGIYREVETEVTCDTCGERIKAWSSAGTGVSRAWAAYYAISIQSTGNGGISWSYSTSYIRVADGVIVGYWT